MLALKFLIKFLGILNRDATPKAIAGGMALGFIIGMTPFTSLHNLIVLGLLIVLRVNFTSGMLAWGVFSGVGYLLDPLSNKIGYWLLTLPGLKATWTGMYNTPVIPWTKFNNTLTLGSLVLSVLLALPVYFILKWAVVQYRVKVMAVIMKWKIVHLIMGSRLFLTYQRFAG
ncbi:MAG: TIGR03546 family protein [Candidatus Coatesbacteria bacterium]